MRLFTHKYENEQMLTAFLEREIAGHDGTVFIQLFSGIFDKGLLASVLGRIAAELPKAVVIGATTAGEVMDGRLCSGQIVIAAACFDATEVRTRYYPAADFESGVRAAREMVTERTNACIAFCEGLGEDSESFLEGMASVRGDTLVAGGNAGDDLTFTRTYIMSGTTIYDKGVVIAALESDVLQVHNAYSLHWTPVGKELTVTRADKNVVYEIDGRPVSERYAHYLGPETVERVPAGAIEFPLVREEDGVFVARAPVATSADGGFVYAGHFKAGDRVRFAIGNVEEVLNHATDIRDAVARRPAEATFIYSCSVRKLFLQEQLNYEFGLIDEVAPTAGFFTYGEFYHSDTRNQLLNVTTTTLSLSESERPAPREFVKEREYRHTMLKSLTHLVNVTQSELDENIAFLDQYKMVLDESSIVSKTDARGFITYVNDAFCEISGYRREELIGQDHNIVRHPDTPPALFKNLWETIRSGKVWKETFKNMAKDGSEYYVKSVIAPIFDDEGRIVEYIAARMDVTDLVLQERIILRQRTDDVTGLLNRTALLGDLESGPPQRTLALLNIDRFSEINDYFGYEIGNDILKLFGAHLAEEFADAGLYRISADEFAIICRGDHGDESWRERVIDHVVNIEKKRFHIEDYDISVDISCGVAAAESSEVYKLAHIALKEAKVKHQKVVFFNENTNLSETIRNNILMIEKIKSAIENDRIVPYFQGIADNRTRQITKYESLIRLIDGDGSVLTPFWFLEHAKKAKLYGTLTRIMIAKTFEICAPLSCEFSLNMTLQDILSEKTRRYLMETLKRTGAGEQLIIEIVESEGIENFEEVEAFFRELRSFGCKIAIDDFGTGYSNFSYLTKLDVDYIKIDGSLIKKIISDEDYLFTVESILHFARKKGIRTVAEFVEDEATVEKLLELGVDYSQGYYFSVPSPDLSPGV